MINYTPRLDKALRIAAWAHEQQNQHRKGTDIPYIMHPTAVMMIASNVTDDEDTLIACLFHDILEDVDSNIYDELQMADDFGANVVSIVKDVTKDDTEIDWHARSRAYLNHLEHGASDQAVIVSACDKIHNLLSVNTDFQDIGDELWLRFSTKDKADQVWWYESILDVVTKRNAPGYLIDTFSRLIWELKSPR